MLYPNDPQPYGSGLSFNVKYEFRETGARRDVLCDDGKRKPTTQTLGHGEKWTLWNVP
jgi:hypothetical protein